MRAIASPLHHPYLSRRHSHSIAAGVLLVGNASAAGIEPSVCSSLLVVGGRILPLASSLRADAVTLALTREGSPNSVIACVMATPTVGPTCQPVLCSTNSNPELQRTYIRPAVASVLMVSQLQPKLEPIARHSFSSIT